MAHNPRALAVVEMLLLTGSTAAKEEEAGSTAAEEEKTRCIFCRDPCPHLLPLENAYEPPESGIAE